MNTTKKNTLNLREKENIDDRIKKGLEKLEKLKGKTFEDINIILERPSLVTFSDIEKIQKFKLGLRHVYPIERFEEEELNGTYGDCLALGNIKFKNEDPEKHEIEKSFFPNNIYREKNLETLLFYEKAIKDFINVRLNTSKYGSSSFTLVTDTYNFGYDLSLYHGLGKVGKSNISASQIKIENTVMLGESDEKNKDLIFSKLIQIIRSMS